MAGKNKLKKFSDIDTFPNVYQNHNTQEPTLINASGEEVDMRNKWTTEHFKNNNPLILELACGKGEYSLGLANTYPNNNYIGVDIKGNRIWRGAKTALENKIPNVAFLRTRIEQLALFFAPGEVSEIWITFADPFLKKSKHRRRLTSAAFIERYRKVLQPGGLIHLKTDEKVLSDYTLEVIDADPEINLKYYHGDIYSEPLKFPELEIKTYYEKMHLEKQKQIQYLQFTIN